MEKSNLILIVEDEPFVALDLKYACEDEGMGAVTVGTCRQAMAMLDEHRFDGAILDVNLGPGETCDAIAKALRESGIPFVLNTGDLECAGEFLRGIEAPIMAKPNSAADVVRRLLEHAEEGA